MAAPATMELVDMAVVGLYFILVLAIGLLVMWKTNRSTVNGYFLAGRSMNWAAVGASLFVSNIGSEHFIGLAGSGAASGLSVAAWELNALLLLQLLGWVFIPVYIQSGVCTMPEYLAKRYGGKRLQVYFAVLSLVLYIFTRLSVDLYAGALFIQESFGWNLYLSIVFLILMTALLTITGGLVTVIYTDIVQAVLMISGALCLAGISFSKGCGTSTWRRTPNITAIMLSSPNLTYPESCLTHVQPKPDSLRMLRGPRDPDIPWPGFLLGQTPASIWYWCTDQVIVQRVLAAKNIAHAKGSTIMAGCLKILPMFVIVIPGMIARILFADELACISPEHCMHVCGSSAGCSNVAYPRLVMAVMPPGLRGLMVAVMIAALMSELDSIFNSSSTIFTLDIYKMMRKQASSLELMIVGRLFVVFMVVVSIAWVPVIIEMQGGQMFYYIQEVTDYLTPPIATMFLISILWHRCNETGAFWGGIVGFALGAARLVLSYIYREPRCDQPDERPFFIKDVHFMYVAAILFWVSGVVAVIVSLCTPPPKKEQIRNTTLWGFLRKKKLKQKEEERNRLENASKPLRDGFQNVSPVDETHQNRLNKSSFEAGHAGAARNNRTEPFHGGPQPGHNTETVEMGGMADSPEGCYARAEGGLCVKFLQCFCGLEKPSRDKSLSVQEAGKRVDELLHESPRAALMLNIGLVAIMSVGVFLFIYFSV
ncbi:unnamed protein product [Tetraodon nigroviridis]|uniref:Sodium/myo-inositol cotransporter n=1 Tax=Tetraodon nigroviridis TaxID=99883 RepID=Q4RY63_TETNG|nr:unnamed protein product [Tetraodon nigroviridis]